RPRREDLASLWKDLGGDAARAQRAVWLFLRAPRQAVAYLGEKLRPVRAVEGAVIERLIAGLASQRFAERERSTRELLCLDRLAGPALRRGLGAWPLPEPRRRVEELLRLLDEPLPSGERLQAYRPLGVLEHAGTPEARQLLDALAGGAPEPRLTGEAGAALKRLDRRP